ncbi:solute carrier family 22 member 3-like [Anopheles ziemanni]|uniref:solute carrier family 22 member 3-like n=1 Tax=Anopheles coustani TaxID=139045 RepID=UPI00265ACAA7|nr:solute carrier family 22 member 3-like [Anopheles coustani]XP_058174184.1 solute carrier family 22 member 3-like [Anopheles ziemanni]
MSKSAEAGSRGIELEDLLAETGQFGRFQLWQCTLLLLPVIFTAFSNLCYVFTAGDVHYRCYVPECDTGSEVIPFAPDWLRDAVPYGASSKLPAKCDRYQPLPGNGTDETALACDASRFNRSAVERCSSFVFEDPTERTVVNEFNLTCDDNRWKVTLVGTIHSVGQFVSLAMTGLISDRFGRRWTLLLGVGLGAVLAIVRSFTNSYRSFLMLEFLEAMFGSTSYTTAFILILELVEPRRRVVVKSVILVAYALAESVLGLLAMQFRNWRTLSLVLFVPGVVSIPLLFTTVESVRWLVTKDRQATAVRILQRVARVNGRPPISQDTLDDFCLHQKAKLESEQHSGGKRSFVKLLLQTCQNRHLLLRIANCSFCWFTNAMVYYGLTLNSVTLAGDKYSNFIFITLAEIPPSLAINCILSRFGRRKTQCGSLILSGVFCLLALTALKDITWLNVSLFLMSKMAISLSFSTLYIYTAEIFPTNLRQSFISFCSMVGRFGSMLAPQMPLLQALWAPLPMVLFGSVAVLSGVLVLDFPETTDATLPNTIEEAVELRSPTTKQAPVEPEKGSYSAPG